MGLSVQYISGQAGTGKTTAVRTMIALNPKIALLCSTTGISAVNLGASTINSVLNYYDTSDLRDKYITGRLFWRMMQQFNGPEAYRGLALDEVSMLDGDQLDIIHDTMERVSQKVKHDLCLIVTGDFAQLPPVKAKWAFEAKCWPKFMEDDNHIHLTDVHRQSNPLFLEALNSFRQGDGRRGVDLLKQCGVVFNPSLVKFNGTTILPKNDMIDSYNKLRYDELDTTSFKVNNIRSGESSRDWKFIPEALELKIGALVMILANDPQNFTYANGDLGIVEGFDSPSRTFHVKLHRNNSVVPISMIHRVNKNMATRQVLGDIDYMPLRLAYAASVHRSQGLTLDNVQIDPRDRFFGQPGMLYVAVSRLRSPEGLRAVGSEDVWVHRCAMNAKVKEYV